MPQHPLTEAIKMCEKFLESKTTTNIRIDILHKLLVSASKENICLSCKTNNPCKTNKEK